ncbi:MAG: radical SAM protein [Candidatus Xenobia bacterium]
MTRHRHAPRPEFALLWSNDAGEILDDSHFGMLGRSGHDLRPAGSREMMPAPPGTQFHLLPGRTPLALDRHGDPVAIDGRLAVAAIMPTGYARTLMPAFRREPGAPILPLFGYTACAFKEDQMWVAAVPTEESYRWSNAQYDTPDLPKRVARALRGHPQNRLLVQLKRCALEYHCFTAQNVFYQRWEGAIPVSPACNAVCRGCISLQEPDQPPSPQERLDFVPTLEEIVEVTIEHLERDAKAIMSFGQGCEGEPLLQADLIAKAIQRVRQKVTHGTLHLNTNASQPRKLAKVLAAGLDSIRVSLNSVHAPWYEAYYRPRNYGFQHVEESVRLSREKGIFISLNLLFMPGVNDHPDEVERLIAFIQRYRIDKVQMRNLNIDPDEYLPCLPDWHSGGIGIPGMLDRMREACPWLAIGNFSPPVLARSPQHADGIG